MESIYVSQKDMLEICQDGDKYFLRYPTFNITCPEVIREIPKEAADSYMSGEHTGKELMTYAQYGFWKSKKQYTQDESGKLFIENHPSFILKTQEILVVFLQQRNLDKLSPKPLFQNWNLANLMQLV